MTHSRRSAIGLTLTGLVAATADLAYAGSGLVHQNEPVSSQNGTKMLLSSDLTSIEAVRIFTDGSGNSIFERVVFTANERPFFGVPGGLKEYIRFKAHKFSIFSAPPNVDLPMHDVGPGPIKEMFYTIQGSSELILRSGQRYMINAGTLIFIEDHNSNGRGGRTGPEGYLAINVGYERDV